MFNAIKQSQWIQQGLKSYAEWMAKRSPRDKQALVFMLAIVVLFLGYSLVWSPIHQSYDKAQSRLDVAHQKWQWLNAQIPVWEKQDRAAPQLKLNSQSELMQYLQTQLKQQNLFQTIEKMTPQQKSVEMTFKAVNAPRFFRWLSQMEKQGLVAQRLQVDLVKTGLVDAKVSFEVIL